MVYDTNMSLVWQRVPVSASCACFVILLGTVIMPAIASHGLFVGVSLLACVEKLAATANTVSVERDWVCSGNPLLMACAVLTVTGRRDIRYSGCVETRYGMPHSTWLDIAD